MNLHNTPIDFIAYDADGQIVLLAEAKSRLGTSGTWASKLRRNMLAHGLLPKSRFFLIATPERMYGWKQESLPASEICHSSRSTHGRPYSLTLQSSARILTASVRRLLTCFFLPG
jgi:hypothetical protein